MTKVALLPLSERLQAMKGVLVKKFSSERDKVLACLEALGEEGNLESLVLSLIPVDRFYAPIGGLPGYFVKLLSLVSEDEETGTEQVRYLPPPAFSISCMNEELKEWVSQGIQALPTLAEVYPVGGAADRLRLHDETTGEALPAACFEFCGKTLLEWLIRDLEGREYLYYKLYGKRVLTPVALMTSQEKDNHARLLALFEEKNWFSRPRDSFFLFCQPLVPSIHHDGSLALMKPGGHGVIWRLMEQEGVFKWLESQGRTKALVRQINNPVAGMGCLLLGFYGLGVLKKKLFGFVSCPRLPDAAEGVNALVERKGALSLTNVEYCGPQKTTFEDSAYLANANILFADLKSLQKAMKHLPFPGLLVNWKKVPAQNEEKEIARLESTMQNIAEAPLFSMPASQALDELPSFLAVGKRYRTLSAIKRSMKGTQLLETPEGCLFDICLIAKGLLEKCGFQLPEFDLESFLAKGPPFLFFHHPALGPLSSIIQQKLRGGVISERSELLLELAEVDIENLKLHGSLRVLGAEGSRCTLKDIQVTNHGIHNRESSALARGRIVRVEECLIEIEEGGEFEAVGVRFSGKQHIHVKKGERVRAIQAGSRIRLLREKITSPSWQWRYRLTPTHDIVLEK